MEDRTPGDRRLAFMEENSFLSVSQHKILCWLGNSNNGKDYISLGRRDAKDIGASDDKRLPVEI